MNVMQGSTAVAANAVSANVLAGALFEFVQRPSAISLLTTGSAAGLNVTLLIAGRAVINDQPINANNRIPIVPDDFLLRAGALAGARLILTFRNTTAGALTANWRVEVGAVA